MMKIKHGIPKHEYFMIVQPKSDQTYGQRIQLDKERGFEKVEMKCPNSGKMIETELHDIFDSHVKLMPRMLTYAAYGVSPEELELKLCKKYDTLAINPYVEFLLLKRI